MRMQTTNYFISLCLLLLGMNSVQAQDSLMIQKPDSLIVKVKVVYSAMDSVTVENATPLIAGLPAFIVNLETSLREEPHYRAGIKTRLFPGTRVEVLDPYNYLQWTKVKVGDKIGWAKKECLDPETGEIDHTEFLEKNIRSL